MLEKSKSAHLRSGHIVHVKTYLDQLVGLISELSGG
jgi:hypothetical protein